METVETMLKRAEQECKDADLGTVRIIDALSEDEAKALCEYLENELEVTPERYFENGGLQWTVSWDLADA